MGWTRRAEVIPVGSRSAIRERNLLTVRVLSRGWLLVLSCSVLATLLVPAGSAAAADDVVLLAELAAASDSPQYLQPLGADVGGHWSSATRTTRRRGSIRPARATPQREDRLPDPTVIGDLLSSYDTADDDAALAHDRRRDPARHRAATRARPSSPGLRPGISPSRGTDPTTWSPSTSSPATYEHGDRHRRVRSTEPSPGRSALAAPSSRSVGWWYYPLRRHASRPASRSRPRPGADDCQLTTAHLYCWSATKLTRLPLSGDPAPRSPGRRSRSWRPAPASPSPPRMRGT